MANELVNEGKDCCKENKAQEDNGCCLLSIMESAGRGVANGIGNAMKGAETVGSAAITAAANGVGLNLSKETSDGIAKGLIIGAAGVAVDQAMKHPREAATAIGIAAGVGVVGAAINEALKEKNPAVDCAKDMAVGAIVGGAAGAALTGDMTRAATLAALGGVTGCAARCAAEMMKPACCVKPNDAVSVAKELGKAVLDHVQKRPIETAAEGIVAGAGGIITGAMAHKIAEKNCCPNIVQKAVQGAAKEIQRQAEMMKDMLFPHPLLEIGPGQVRGGAEKVGEAVAAGAAAGFVAGEAVKVGVQAAKSVQSDVEKHRQANPQASQIERAAGQAIGGVIAGKAVGTAIEYGDAKARQAYKFVKSWFE